MTAETQNSETESTSNSSSFPSSPTSPHSPPSALPLQNSVSQAKAENPESKKVKRIRDSSKHPVYRGVRMRNWGKWVSEIREPRKKSRIWLGSFPVPEMAAKAYDVAAYCLKGRKAQLNFPDEVELLPRPSTCAARDIQEAAAKAAHAMKASAKKNSIVSDGDGDSGGDDFWGEIELPELMNSGCFWSSPSGSSWAPSGDITAWPEMELPSQQQPFMACL